MTKYLADGQEVEVIEETKNGYIVSEIFTYDEEEDNQEPYFAPPYLIEKSKVFDFIPVFKYEESISKAMEREKHYLNSLEELSKLFNSLTNEVNKLSKVKTDLNKMIVNYSDFANAESLTFMEENYFHPVTVKDFTKSGWGDNRNISGFKIFFTAIYQREEQPVTVASLDWDGRSYSSSKINMQFGLLINATQEEITAKALEVNAGREPNYMFGENTPDEYLTPELILKKKDLIKRKKESAISNLEQEIEQKTKALENLKSQSNEKN